MKRLLTSSIFFLLFFSSIQVVSASSLILKTDFRIWQPNLKYVDLYSDYKKTTFNGIPVKFDANNDSLTDLPLKVKTVKGLDLMKIRHWLETKIAPDITRAREDVSITLNDKGEPQFEGSGLYGRSLDLDRAAPLVKKAIETNQEFVNLPLIREDPIVKVTKKLRDLGITELISSGETDFSGSPYNRRNNISVGLKKFNGHIVKPNEEFVFGNVLGPVEKYTGYLPELVIKGDRTIPEYGGGLCQVSTTIYRAILSGGFPVTKRRNHSYAVSYYTPIGLDATVYPPLVDLKFVNDSPNHLLMQSFTIGGMAYYNFYGTKDGRKVSMIGPYYSNRKKPPPPRIEYSTELAPGEAKKLGHAVSGITADWYRRVTYKNPEKKPYLEHIHSKYQARPDFSVIGVSRSDEATKNGLLKVGY